MVELIKYKESDYDFSESTWHMIYAFEARLKSKRYYKRVNRNEEEVKKVVEWIHEILATKEFEKIITGQKLYRFINKETIEREAKLFNKFYLKCRLEKAFNKNKYYLPKISCRGLKFKIEDVREFLIIIQTAEENGVLNEFLEIPDVWYIIRNIKENYNDIIRTTLNYKCY